MIHHVLHNDIRWRVREGYAWLVAPGGPFDRLHSGAAGQDVTVVRDNIIRASYLVRTGRDDCPEVFVKHYKAGKIRDAFKYLVLPSKAEGEWHTLSKFEQRGIPCPRPIAYGVRRKFGLVCEGFLITESLAPAVPLNEYLRQKHLGVKERRELAELLGRLVAMLHRARIYYRDLHAGNILLRTAGPCAGTLVCVDLHRAFVLPFLPTWPAIDDIAHLCNSLQAGKGDGLSFFRTYCTMRFGSCEAGSHLSERIAARRTVLERRRISSRSKRCVKNSTVFEVRRRLTETYFGRRDFGYDAARRAIRAHLAGEGQVLKTSSKSTITVHPHTENGGVCVKGYRIRGLRYGFKQIFQQTRGRRSWKAAHGLLVRGVDTPTPLALVERRIGPFVREVYFITRWIPEARELNDYVLSDGFGERKREFIGALATAIRRLHLQNVYHADLKSNNVLVVPHGTEGWRFCFVDLDRVSFGRHLSLRQRVNNLAQLNASVADRITVRERLHFFRIYAKETPLWQMRKHCYRKIIEIGRKKNTAPYGIHFSPSH